MIGTRVGRYRITEELGDGGHAFVFKGIDEENSSEIVAVKMLKPSVANEDNLETRFMKEADVLRELRHEGIVAFKDYRFQNGWHFLVMEFMDQGSVENLIRSMGPIEPKYAVPIFHGILRAMEHIHAKGYVHRDIKPNNILLNRHGQAKLADFGIMKILDDKSHLTKQGFVLGTTLYMAPEYISQGKIDAKTDIYALGVTLFEMLTTRKPFEFEYDDEPLIAFAKRVCMGTPTPPSAYRPTDEALERIVMKAIAQDPKRRYATAAQFRADLEAAFPDLVRRPIHIPDGRARTQLLAIAKEARPEPRPAKPVAAGEKGARRAATAAGDPAPPRRSARFVAKRDPAETRRRRLLAILLALPPILGAAAIALLRTPLLLTLAAAALPYAVILPLFVRRVRKAASDQTRIGRTSERIPAPDEDRAAEDVAPDDAKAPAASGADDEDPVPYMGGFQTNQPFSMTAKSELNAYLECLTGPDAGKRFGLRPISRIGRDLRLDIRPRDQEISRHHAMLSFDGRAFVLRDTGSTNGTFVNERRVDADVILKDGDIVRVGRTGMRFEYKEARAASA